MSDVILEVKNLAKFFDATKVLKDINLTVNKGDVIAIIGPSGSGKSTFLRCLNLLEEPTRGVLTFEGNDYFSIEKCKDDFVNYEEFNKAESDYDVRIVDAEDNLAIYQNLRIEGDRSKENKQKIKECKKIYKATLKSKPNKIDYFDQKAKDDYDVRIVDAEDNLAIYQNLRIEGDKSKENKQKIKECKKIYRATLKSKPNAVDYFDQKAYEAFIAEHPIISIGESGKNKLRTKMTMVFQSFNLFNNMDVLRNCTLAQERVLHRSLEESKQRAFKELANVNMQDRMNYRPRALSGGQKQRVAIARALCMDPDIILFDEPTSALDPEMAQEVLAVMKKLASEGRTMIVVTHEMNFARKVANRVVFMEDGFVVESGPSEEFFANPKEKRSQEFLRMFANNK